MQAADEFQSSSEDEETADLAEQMSASASDDGSRQARELRELADSYDLFRARFAEKKRR